MDIHQLTDALGRDTIAEAVGVKRGAVDIAVARGKLPASWFLAVGDLCGAAGVECPVELFAMKGLSSATAPAGRRSA